MTTPLCPPCVPSPSAASSKPSFVDVDTQKWRKRTGIQPPPSKVRGLQPSGSILDDQRRSESVARGQVSAAVGRSRRRGCVPGVSRAVEAAPCVHGGAS